MHDSPVGGHLGQDKVIGKLQQRFYWPGSIIDAKHWCNTCPSCAARKTHPPRQQAPLNTITTGTPMQTVAVDILGPLPQTSSGNRYILVAMDYFTRWDEAYAIQNQEATTVTDPISSSDFHPLNSYIVTRAVSSSRPSCVRCATAWGSTKLVRLPTTHRVMGWWKDLTGPF